MKFNSIMDWHTSEDYVDTEWICAKATLSSSGNTLVVQYTFGQPATKDKLETCILIGVRLIV